jgi:ATP-dependent Clp protease ATP-binding subunit ClpA
MKKCKKIKIRKAHRDYWGISFQKYSRKHQADTNHTPIMANSDQSATQQKKFSENKIDVRFDDSVLSFIAHKAYSPEYGARPVRRAIKENIVDALCMSILRQEVNKEQPIVVRVDDNQILISNQ